MTSFHQTSVLVVGGAGFVGSNLVRSLLSTTPAISVTVVDNLLSAERINVIADPRVEFIEGSIADDTILASLSDRFDYVFHLATYHGNQSSIHDPLADHANNTLTTLKLFERLKTFKHLKKVVYSGAGCAVAEKTFDQAAATVESELVSLEMDSPYSISKIIGEFYSKYYCKQHQLPVVRARFQNVYGPWEILGAGEWRGTPATVWRNVTPTFIFKALNGESLPLENDGVATRDFIYVDDIVRGLIACALRGQVGDVYNLATGHEIAIRQLAEVINALAENRAPIHWLPKRTWDNSGKRYGCPEKARRVLGFAAATPLEQGLKATIAWTRQHQPLIAQTMRKHAHRM
jgi:UDP-glucose 4-epimerase